MGITWIDSLKTLCKKDSLSSEHMIVQSCLHTDLLKSSPICEMLKYVIDVINKAGSLVPKGLCIPQAQFCLISVRGSSHRGDANFTQVSKINMAMIKGI